MKNSFVKDVYKVGLALMIWIFFLMLSFEAFSQVQKEERQAPPMEQLPQEQNQLAVNYDDEIEKDELPENVITSLKDNYSKYEMKEVYRGSDGSYKVKLKGDEKKIVAFYDAAGDFLRIENDESEETINDDWR